MSVQPLTYERKECTFDVRFFGFDPETFPFDRDCFFPGILTRGGTPGKYTYFPSAVQPYALCVLNCTLEMMQEAFKSYPGIKMVFINEKMIVNGNN